MHNSMQLCTQTSASTTRRIPRPFPSPSLPVPSEMDESQRPVFWLSFSVPGRALVGLEEGTGYVERERVTTVVHGLGFDWCIALIPGLGRKGGFYAGLKALEPDFHIPSLRGRSLFTRARLATESGWRTAEAEGGGRRVLGHWSWATTPLDFLNNVGIVGFVALSTANRRPDETLLVETQLEIHADALHPQRILPPLRIATSNGLVSALITSVSPCPSSPTAHSRPWSTSSQMRAEGGLGSIEVRCQNDEFLWPNLAALGLVSDFFDRLPYMIFLIEAVRNRHHHGNFVCFLCHGEVTPIIGSFLEGRTQRESGDVRDPCRPICLRSPLYGSSHGPLPRAHFQRLGLS